MENSKIEWTHHTFNPWWGCIKVSPGCEHCYAETWAKRTGHAVWGPAKTTPRREASANYWKQPYKWNKEAKESGERRRVFCASMADVFEDHPQLVEPRKRLFDLISETPHLDWLLLTKRPENIRGMRVVAGYSPALPQNVWIGTSVENQKYADERIAALLSVPASVHFLSCEPLLGPLHILESIQRGFERRAPLDCINFVDGLGYGIDWVIVGGESGPHARPMHPDWARSLRDQCQDAGVAFFFKQWGEYAPLDQVEYTEPGDYSRKTYSFSDGPRMSTTLHRIGKAAAGRLLDGREWNELPVVETTTGRP